MEIADTKEKWNNHESHEAEQTRRSLLRLETDVDLYKKTIADLTEQNYQLMIRIKELTGTQCCGGKNHEK
tara:strand:- start:323 stop:532 length:210 start_codon:yes stop_codon:yes gene_type:complete